MIGGAGDGLIKDATTATFMKDVIEESRKQPVLVDFWAPWCGPCKQLTPVLEKSVRAAKGKVKLVKMDIDKNPEIPGQMGIQSIPAVIAFVNGQPADGFLGALPEGQVVAFLERLTKEKLGGGDEGADLLKNAEAALAQGDATTAAEIYAAVLATDSANVAAIAGLARAHIKLGTLEQAKRMLAMVPEAKRNDPAVAAAQAALDLAEQAKSVGPLDELEAKVNANPPSEAPRQDDAPETAPSELPLLRPRWRDRSRFLLQEQKATEEGVAPRSARSGADHALLHQGSRSSPPRGLRGRAKRCWRLAE